jgi:hypothetical protein
MRKRLQQIIEWSGLKPKQLEEATGLDRNIWISLRYGRQRVNEDHIEAINKLWPQYIYWLVTGETLPKAGQISPDMEDRHQKVAENKTSY